MSDMEAKPQFRWRYYIDKRFQNAAILRFSAIAVMVVLVTLGMLWMIGENPYPLLSDDAGLLFSVNMEKPYTCVKPDGTVDHIPVPLKSYNAFQLFWRPIAYVSALNLIMIVVFSILYSHSMAGPIRNIRRSLQEMAAGGSVRPIRVRKGDQFQDLVDDLNLLIEKRVK